jgi:steroid 5-alpha reductase family enzyme
MTVQTLMLIVFSAALAALARMTLYVVSLLRHETCHIDYIFSRALVLGSIAPHLPKVMRIQSVSRIGMLFSGNHPNEVVVL